MLLDNGADIDARGDMRGTALELASNNGYENVVRMLLDNGADVNALGNGSEGTAL